MPTYAVGVARRVEMTLAAVKLTQAQAARMTGVSPQVLNNFLRRPKGGAGIDVQTALKLCDGLSLTLDWIYRGRCDYLPAKIREAFAQYERELKTQRKRKVTPKPKQDRSNDQRGDDDDFLCV